MSIEITGSVQWRAWQDRVLPPVERVRDGLWSIPVPIPDNPLRYVLVYALESRDGLVLIDAGWDDDESWRALEAGLASIGGGVQDVRAVLVTHHHADHLGLADRVREASGAWIALHRLDADHIGPAQGEAEMLTGRLREHLELHGASVVEARGIADQLPTRLITDAPVPDVLLDDGESVRVPGLELRVVWTPGHTPGHSCFYEPGRRLLFSGDHVLPRITPQISVQSRTDGDPLADFLRSLERLERFDVDEVLPAHEYRFRGLGHRLAVMARHHTERLAELYAKVRELPGATGWELASQVTWSRPWESFDPPSRRFALGETLAHLTLLESRKEVGCTTDGAVRWYSRRTDG
ncbi:MBL fold metallo-hydrolase [Streptomyces sp. NPDC051453]|uniref:MBL fold metallo-hydrolase n=1 Tax=Streptomyces sp. NPDC051453 TaxID=3154941 RepID=UPI0034321316